MPDNPSVLGLLQSVPEVTPQEEFELEASRVRDRLNLDSFVGPGTAAVTSSVIGLAGLAARPVDAVFGTGYADEAVRARGLIGRAADQALEDRPLSDTGLRVSRAARGAAESTLQNVAFSPLGPSGLIVGGALSAANEKYTQAKDAGFSQPGALAAALTTGGIEGTITAFFNRIGLGGLESGFKTSLKTSLAQNASQYLTRSLLNAGVSVGGEELEELSIMMAQSVADQVSGLDPNALEMDRVLDNAYDTMLTTAFASGAGGPIRTLAEARQRGKRAKGFQGLSDRMHQEVQEAQAAAAMYENYLANAPDDVSAAIEDIAPQDGVLSKAVDLAKAERMAQIRSQLSVMEQRDITGLSDADIELAGLEAGLVELESRGDDVGALRKRVVEAATPRAVQQASEAVRGEIPETRRREQFERAARAAELQEAIEPQVQAMDLGQELQELREDTGPETQDVASRSEARDVIRQGSTALNRVLDRFEQQGADPESIESLRQGIENLDAIEDPDMARERVGLMAALLNLTTPDEMDFDATSEFMLELADVQQRELRAIDQPQQRQAEIAGRGRDVLRQLQTVRQQAVEQGVGDARLQQIDDQIRQTEELVSQLEEAEAPQQEEPEAPQQEEPEAPQQAPVQDGYQQIEVTGEELVFSSLPDEVQQSILDTAESAFEEAAPAGASVRQEAGHVVVELSDKTNVAVIVASQDEALTVAADDANAVPAYRSMEAHGVVPTTGRGANQRQMELREWVEMSAKERKRTLKRQGIYPPAWLVSVADESPVPITADALIYMTSDIVADQTDPAAIAAEELNHFIVSRLLSDRELQVVAEGMSREGVITSVPEDLRGAVFTEAVWQRYKQHVQGQRASGRAGNIFTNLFNWAKGLLGMRQRVGSMAPIDRMQEVFDNIAAGRVTARPVVAPTALPQSASVDIVGQNRLQEAIRRREAEQRARMREFRRRQQPQTPEEAEARAEVLAREEQARDVGRREVAEQRAATAQQIQPLQQEVNDLRQENLDLREELAGTEDEGRSAELASQLAVNARRIEQLRIDIENLRIPTRPVGAELQAEEAARRAPRSTPADTSDIGATLFSFTQSGQLLPEDLPNGSEVGGENIKNKANPAGTNLGRVVIRRLQARNDIEEESALSFEQMEQMGSDQLAGYADTPAFIRAVDRRVRAAVAKTVRQDGVNSKTFVRDADRPTGAVAVSVAESAALRQAMNKTAFEASELIRQRNEAKRQGDNRTANLLKQRINQKLKLYGKTLALYDLAGRSQAMGLAMRRDFIETPEQRLEMFYHSFGEMTKPQRGVVAKLYAKNEFAEAQRRAAEFTQENMEKVLKTFRRRKIKNAKGSVISEMGDITLEDMRDIDTFFAFLSVTNQAKEGIRGGEYINAFMLQNMLSPGTVGINVGGNMLNLLKEGAMELPAGVVLDMLRAASGGQIKLANAPTTRAATAGIKAAFFSMGTALPNALHAFLYGRSRSKEELQSYGQRVAEEERRARSSDRGGKRGIAINPIFRAVGAVDEVYYSAAAQAAIASEAMKIAQLEEGRVGDDLEARVTTLIQKAADPTDQSPDAMRVKQRALAYASDVTFKLDETTDFSDRWVGKILQGLQRMRSAAIEVNPEAGAIPLPKAARRAVASAINGWKPGLLLVPFFSTMVRIFGASLNLTPVGLLNAYGNAVTAQSATDPNRRDVAKIRGWRALHQSITGTVLMAFLMSLEDDEGEALLAGTIDPRERVKRALAYETGDVQTFTVGGVTINYRRLEPLAIPMAAAADIRDAFSATGPEAGKPFDRRMHSLAEKLYVNLFDKNFTQSIRNLLETPMSQEESRFGNFFNNVEGAFTPGAGTVRFFHRIMDPTIRSSRHADTLYGAGPTIERLTTPGAAQGRREGAAFALLDQLGFTVLPETPEHADELIGWIERTNESLAEEGRDTWRPSKVARRFRVAGETYDLEGDDYSELQRLAAEEFQRVTEGFRFGRAGTESQLDRLRSLHNAAKARARRQFARQQRQGTR